MLFFCCRHGIKWPFFTKLIQKSICHIFQNTVNEGVTQVILLGGVNQACFTRPSSFWSEVMWSWSELITGRHAWSKAADTTGGTAHPFWCLVWMGGYGKDSFRTVLSLNAQEHFKICQPIFPGFYFWSLLFSQWTWDVCTAMLWWYEQEEKLLQQDIVFHLISALSDYQIGFTDVA